MACFNKEEGYDTIEFLHRLRPDLDRFIRQHHSILVQNPPLKRRIADKDGLMAFLRSPYTDQMAHDLSLNMFEFF